METHIPNPAEPFTILKGELRARFAARGPRHGIARVVDVLMLGLFMTVISLFARLAERQAVCRDGAGAEPGRLDAAAGVAADRVVDAGAPDAGRRVAVRAAVAAADSMLVCDDGTDEGCIRKEAGVRRVWTTVTQGVPALEYGCRVFGVVFAKTEFAVGQNCADFVAI